MSPNNEQLEVDLSSQRNYSTIAVDGTFLYTHTPSGLRKIGTGKNGTIQGQVYCHRTSYRNKEHGWLVFLNKILVFRSRSLLSQSSIVGLAIDPTTLEDLGEVVLMNCSNSRLKCENMGHLTTDGCYLYVLSSSDRECEAVGAIQRTWDINVLSLNQNSLGGWQAVLLSEIHLPVGRAQFPLRWRSDISTTASASDSSHALVQSTMLSYPSALQLRVGAKLDVLDSISNWCLATIVKVSPGGVRVLVHYDGWSPKWDEWIDASSPRLGVAGEFSNNPNATIKSPGVRFMASGTPKDKLDPAVQWQIWKRNGSADKIHDAEASQWCDVSPKLNALVETAYVKGHRLAVSPFSAAETGISSALKRAPKFPNDVLVFQHSEIPDVVPQHWPNDQKRQRNVSTKSDTPASTSDGVKSRSDADNDALSSMVASSIDEKAQSRIINFDGFYHVDTSHGLRSPLRRQIRLSIPGQEDIDDIKARTEYAEFFLEDIRFYCTGKELVFLIPPGCTPQVRHFFTSQTPSNNAAVGQDNEHSMFRIFSLSSDINQCQPGGITHSEPRVSFQLSEKEEDQLRILSHSMSTAQMDLALAVHHRILTNLESSSCSSSAKGIPKRALWHGDIWMNLAGDAVEPGPPSIFLLADTSNTPNTKVLERTWRQAASSMLATPTALAFDPSSNAIWMHQAAHQRFSFWSNTLLAGYRGGKLVSQPTGHVSRNISVLPLITAAEVSPAYKSWLHDFFRNCELERQRALAAFFDFTHAATSKWLVASSFNYPLFALLNATLADILGRFTFTFENYQTNLELAQQASNSLLLIDLVESLRALFALFGLITQQRQQHITDHLTASGTSNFPAALPSAHFFTHLDRLCAVEKTIDNLLADLLIKDGTSSLNFDVSTESDQINYPYLCKVLLRQKLVESLSALKTDSFNYLTHIIGLVASYPHLLSCVLRSRFQLHLQHDKIVTLILSSHRSDLLNFFLFSSSSENESSTQESHNWTHQDLMLFLENVIEQCRSQCEQEFRNCKLTDQHATTQKCQHLPSGCNQESLGCISSQVQLLLVLQRLLLSSYQLCYAPSPSYDVSSKTILVYLLQSYVSAVLTACTSVLDSATLLSTSPSFTHSTVYLSREEKQGADSQNPQLNSSILLPHFSALLHRSFVGQCLPVLLTALCSPTLSPVWLSQQPSSLIGSKDSYSELFFVSLSSVLTSIVHFQSQFDFSTNPGSASSQSTLKFSQLDFFSSYRPVDEDISGQHYAGASVLGIDELVVALPSRKLESNHPYEVSSKVLEGRIAAHNAVGIILHFDPRCSMKLSGTQDHGLHLNSSQYSAISSWALNIGGRALVSSDSTAADQDYFGDDSLFRNAIDFVAASKSASLASKSSGHSIPSAPWPMGSFLRVAEPGLNFLWRPETPHAIANAAISSVFDAASNNVSLASNCELMDPAYGIKCCGFAYISPTTTPLLWFQQLHSTAILAYTDLSFRCNFSEGSFQQTATASSPLMKLELSLFSRGANSVSTSITLSSTHIANLLDKFITISREHGWSSRAIIPEAMRTSISKCRDLFVSAVLWHCNLVQSSFDLIAGKSCNISIFEPVWTSVCKFESWLLVTSRSRASFSRMLQAIRDSLSKKNENGCKCFVCSNCRCWSISPPASFQAGSGLSVCLACNQDIERCGAPSNMDSIPMSTLIADYSDVYDQLCALPESELTRFFARSIKVPGGASASTRSVSEQLLVSMVFEASLTVSAESNHISDLCNSISAMLGFLLEYKPLLHDPPTDSMSADSVCVQISTFLNGSLPQSPLASEGAPTPTSIRAELDRRNLRIQFFSQHVQRLRQLTESKLLQGCEQLLWFHLPHIVPVAESSNATFPASELLDQLQLQLVQVAEETLTTHRPTSSDYGRMVAASNFLCSLSSVTFRATSSSSDAFKIDLSEIILRSAIKQWELCILLSKEKLDQQSTLDSCMSRRFSNDCLLEVWNCISCIDSGFSADMCIVCALRCHASQRHKVKFKGLSKLSICSCSSASQNIRCKCNHFSDSERAFNASRNIANQLIQAWSRAVTQLQIEPRFALTFQRAISHLIDASTSFLRQHHPNGTVATEALMKLLTLCWRLRGAFKLLSAPLLASITSLLISLLNPRIPLHAQRIATQLCSEFLPILASYFATEDSEVTATVRLGVLQLYPPDEPNLSSKSTCALLLCALLRAIGAAVVFPLCIKPQSVVNASSAPDYAPPAILSDEEYYSVTIAKTFDTEADNSPVVSKAVKSANKIFSVEDLLSNFSSDLIKAFNNAKKIEVSKLVSQQGFEIEVDEWIQNSNDPIYASFTKGVQNRIDEKGTSVVFTGPLNICNEIASSIAAHPDNRFSVAVVKNEPNNRVNESCLPRVRESCGSPQQDLQSAQLYLRLFEAVYQSCKTDSFFNVQLDSVLMNAVRYLANSALKVSSTDLLASEPELLSESLGAACILSGAVGLLGPLHVGAKISINMDPFYSSQYLWASEFQERSTPSYASNVRYGTVVKVFPRHVSVIFVDDPRGCISQVPSERCIPFEWSWRRQQNSVGFDKPVIVKDFMEQIWSRYPSNGMDDLAIPGEMIVSSSISSKNPMLLAHMAECLCSAVIDVASSSFVNIRSSLLSSIIISRAINAVTSLVISSLDKPYSILQLNKFRSCLDVLLSKGPALIAPSLSLLCLKESWANTMNMFRLVSLSPVSSLTNDSSCPGWNESTAINCILSQNNRRLKYAAGQRRPRTAISERILLNDICPTTVLASKGFFLHPTLNSYFEIKIINMGTEPLSIGLRPGKVAGRTSDIMPQGWGHGSLVLHCRPSVTSIGLKGTKAVFKGHAKVIPTASDALIVTAFVDAQPLGTAADTASISQFTSGVSELEDFLAATTAAAATSQLFATWLASCKGDSSDFKQQPVRTLVLHLLKRVELDCSTPDKESTVYSSSSVDPEAMYSRMSFAVNLLTPMSRYLFLLTLVSLVNHDSPSPLAASSLRTLHHAAPSEVLSMTCKIQSYLAPFLTDSRFRLTELLSDSSVVSGQSTNLIENPEELFSRLFDHLFLLSKSVSQAKGHFYGVRLANSPAPTPRGSLLFLILHSLLFFLFLSVSHVFSYQLRAQIQHCRSLKSMKTLLKPLLQPCLQFIT